MSDWLILRDLEVDSEVNFEVNLEVDFKGNIQHLTSSILWADGILPIYASRNVNELYFSFELLLEHIQSLSQIYH